MCLSVCMYVQTVCICLYMCILCICILCCVYVVCVEMLNLLSHQRNANQNNAEISSYTCQNGWDQKHWWQLMLERMWGKGNTPPLLVRVQNLYSFQSTTLENSMAASQKIDNESVLRFSNSTLEHVPKGYTVYYKEICSTMYIATFIIHNN